MGQATEWLALGIAALTFAGLVGAAGTKTWRTLSAIRELVEYVRDQMRTDHDHVAGQLEDIRRQLEELRDVDEAHRARMRRMVEALNLDPELD